MLIFLSLNANSNDNKLQGSHTKGNAGVDFSTISDIHIKAMPSSVSAGRFIESKRLVRSKALKSRAIKRNRLLSA